MLTLMFSLSALAGPGAPGVLAPQLVDAETRTRVTAEAARQGAVGDEGVLACQDLVSELQLCYRLQVKDTWRWVSRAEVTAWGLTDQALQDAAKGALQTSPFKRRDIEGGGTWWEAQTPPGLETSLLLHPEWLAALGPEVLVGVPGPGVVIAWLPGNPEVDRIMAVAVRRMYEQLDQPITPLVLRWSELGWRTWGQALPTPAGPAP